MIPINNSMVLGFVFGLFFPTHAIITKKWVTSESDTLYLNEAEFRSFNVTKAAGQDLSNMAILGTILSFPTYLIVYVSDWDIFSGYRDGDREKLISDIFLGGVFPFWSLTMATGNLIYKKAVEKDTFNKHALATSWVPYAVAASSILSFSLLTTKILKDCYNSRGLQKSYSGSPINESKCEDFPSSDYIGYSSIITMPWMRFEFSNSRMYLNTLEIKPFKGEKKIVLNFSF